MNTLFYEINKLIRGLMGDVGRRVAEWHFHVLHQVSVRSAEFLYLTNSNFQPIEVVVCSKTRFKVQFNIYWVQCQWFNIQMQDD